MSPNEFHTYTQSLVELANADDRILSLIVLGSTAETHHQPDQWSDHDFWLVVGDGMQEEFHSDLSWIPQHENIALAFRETQHGWKIIFESGHVLEYAIFSKDELSVVRFHHYKVWVDKDTIEQRLLELKASFAPHTEPDVLQIAQHTLSLLVIGMGRYHRGEKVSASFFIKSYALEQLTALIQATTSPQNPHLVDDLNPSRRIELTHPQWSTQLHAIITAPVPDAAQIILDSVIQVADTIPNFPAPAIDMVKGIIWYKP